MDLPKLATDPSNALAVKIPIGQHHSASRPCHRQVKVLNRQIATLFKFLLTHLINCFIMGDNCCKAFGFTAKWDPFYFKYHPQMTTAYRQSLQNTQTFFYSCGWLYLVLWFFFFFFFLHSCKWCSPFVCFQPTACDESHWLEINRFKMDQSFWIYD